MGAIMYLPRSIQFPDSKRAPRGEGEAKKPIKVWMSPEMEETVNQWSHDLNCHPGVIGRWLMGIGAEHLKAEIERELGEEYANRLVS